MELSRSCFNRVRRPDPSEGGDRMRQWPEGYEDMSTDLIFDFGWPMILFADMFSLLFWGALLAFGVWTVRRLTERPAAQTPAMQILQERLARGEIDPDEYERLRRTLNAG